MVYIYVEYVNHFLYSSSKKILVIKKHMKSYNIINEKEHLYKLIFPDSTVNPVFNVLSRCFNFDYFIITYSLLLVMALNFHFSQS